jgi:hypothetical protein
LAKPEIFAPALVLKIEVIHAKYAIEIKPISDWRDVPVEGRLDVLRCLGSSPVPATGKSARS